MSKSLILKSSFILIIILSISSSVFSIHAIKKFHKNNKENPSMNVELSTDFGILNGMIKELLYYDINSDQTFSYRMSQLDWEITPIYYAGITISVNPIRNIHVSSGIWKLLGKNLGKMEDRDWNEGFPDYNGDLNMYSEHDNFLDNGIMFDVNISYSFSLNDRLTISPIAGFSYRQIKMYAQDGYGLYPNATDETNRDINFSGTVITYEQKQMIPYIGVNLSYKANEKLTCSLSGFYTIFASIDANDMHLSNNQDFKDEIRKADYLSLIASFNYNINKDTFLSLSANYIYIPKSMGYAFKRAIGATTYINYLSNQGGTSWSLWGINLSLGIKIDLN